MDNVVSTNKLIQCGVTVSGNEPALELLAKKSGLSKKQIKQAMHKGAVWLRQGGRAQRIRRVTKSFKVGEELYLYYNRNVLDERPLGGQLIADNGAYSVWYKPFGMRSQGSKWGDHCALYRWVQTSLKPERPAFLVHRLDRAATGLMLIAHQKKTAAALARLFEERKINKRYHAIVVGRFSEQVGVWGKKKTFSSAVNGKPAISHARCLAYRPEVDRSLLEVVIETGRKHQIRCHLADAGFPVMGDRLYGGAVKSDENLQLTASSLSFVCPLTGMDKEYILPAKLLPDL